jgi:hypothetical protein
VRRSLLGVGADGGEPALWRLVLSRPVPWSHEGRYTVTVDDLLARAHRRGFRLMDEPAMRAWLQELEAAGIAVEDPPGDWQLTPAGRARFVHAGEMELG